MAAMLEGYQGRRETLRDIRTDRVGAGMISTRGRRAGRGAAIGSWMHIAEFEQPCIVASGSRADMITYFEAE
jgi:hypothetical protein